MHSYKAVLFDLDGTLLDTLEDIALAMNDVLKQFGYPIHPIDDYRYYVGNGIDVLVQRTLPAGKKDDSTIKQCAAKMRQVYGAGWSNNTHLYDGVSELLIGLQSFHLRMAILSNKPDDFTQKMVAHYLSRWKFDMVMGAREDLPKKPESDGALFISEKLQLLPEQFLYIGDTNTDMITASRAGMYPVGATWGFRTREELLANGAKTIVDHPCEVISLFFQ